MINLTFVFLVVLVFVIFIIFVILDRQKALLSYLFSKKDYTKYKKICPRCGSIKISVDFSNPVVWAYGTTSKYKCKECGYLSNSFPEIEEDNIQNYKKELKYKKSEGNLKEIKSELLDTSTGYSVGIMEIILSIVGLILIPIYLVIEGFDPLLLFLLFQALLVIYLVWRIRKRKKSRN